MNVLPPVDFQMSRREVVVLAAALGDVDGALVALDGTSREIHRRTDVRRQLGPLLAAVDRRVQPAVVRADVVEVRFAGDSAMATIVWA
ncbi:MAG: hypothetical protein R2752_02875 [Vicinamibacterales bacterium]